jgi:hypothetical protein
MNSRKRTHSRGKKINPHFWVFCEGKTEEVYVSFLRSKFRIPVSVVPIISGNDIDGKYIRKSKQGKPIHPKDKDFLIFDADVPEVLERLRSIADVKLILSNPSIELWFLLHYKNQKAAISTDDCIRELGNRNRNDYKKGVIDKKLQVKLSENLEAACRRAENLTLFENPSSNVFVLIWELENAK